MDPVDLQLVFSMTPIISHPNQQAVLAQVIQDGLLSFFAVQVCHGNLVADRVRDLGSLRLQHLLKDLQEKS